MRGLGRAQRTLLRLEAVAAYGRGEPVHQIASRTGYTAGYIRSASCSLGIRRLPTEKAGTLGKMLRRRVLVAELHSLDQSVSQVADLLRVGKQSIYHCAQKLGVSFKYDVGAGWAPVIEQARGRAETMAVLYREGHTLEQIGQQFGVSRERIRQIMTKYLGIRGRDGGAAKLAEQNAERRKRRKDGKTLATKGCTWDQYVTIRGRPSYAFAQQRRNAHGRGVGWELNLWQWWTIWQESGHWQERGRTRDSYVMCRHGDTGPYAVGNVFIATASANAREIYHNRLLKAADQMVAA